MKISKAGLISAAAFAAVVTARTAGAQATSPRLSRTVTVMEIAGTRIGMPLDQAKAALSATYRCENFRNAATFREQVDAEVKNRRGESAWGRDNTGVWQLICRGSAGEYMRVDVAHTQGGPVVDQIDLAIPMAGQDRAAFLRQITARYGRPTVGNVETGAWCDAGYQCGDAIANTPGPELVVQSLGDTAKIMATRGKRARDVDAAAVSAAADRIAPRRSSAAF